MVPLRPDAKVMVSPPSTLALCVAERSEMLPLASSAETLGLTAVVSPVVLTVRTLLSSSFSSSAPSDGRADGGAGGTRRRNRPNMVGSSGQEGRAGRRADLGRVSILPQDAGRK